MKQIIILFGTILLGVGIYLLVAGEDNSLKADVENVWRAEIERQRVYP